MEYVQDNELLQGIFPLRQATECTQCLSFTSASLSRWHQSMLCHAGSSAAFTLWVSNLEDTPPPHYHSLSVQEDLVQQAALTGSGDASQRKQIPYCQGICTLGPSPNSNKHNSGGGAEVGGWYNQVCNLCVQVCVCKCVCQCSSEEGRKPSAMVQAYVGSLDQHCSHVTPAYNRLCLLRLDGAWKTAQSPNHSLHPKCRANMMRGISVYEGFI